MVRIAISLVTFGFSSLCFAWMCDPGDTFIGGNYRVEYQACTTSGYCYAYDYNPSTGQYEYFYGFHSWCQGQQERRVEEFQCRKPNGSVYLKTDYGWWSSCQVR